MTYEQAKLKKIELLKIDIKNRLHKYNPNKYSKPRMYSATEALEVAWILVFEHPRYKNPFERDDVFYRTLKNNK